MKIKDIWEIVKEDQLFFPFMVTIPFTLSMESGWERSQIWV